MCGVATLCSKAMKIAKKETIAVTRKTSPGFQLFDKKAAQVAGCWTHRMNLSEMILLKDNHLKFFSSAARAAKHAKETGKKYEIEVENEKDALEFLKHGGVDGLLPGRSSLDAKKFVEIVKICEALSQ